MSSGVESVGVMAYLGPVIVKNRFYAFPGNEL